MKYCMGLLLLLFCYRMQVAAQSKIDRSLTTKIEQLTKDFHGNFGIFIKNLRTGKTVAINSDTLFPTASMVKIPILIGLMDKIESKELSYHQELQYKDSLLYEGVDILGSFRQDEKIELSKLMMLMLSMSDNTASLWLQSLAGGGLRINELLDSNGIKITRVNSRTPGREENRNQYGWGQSSPREMAFIMEKIYKRQLISEEASQKMLRLLGRNYWDEEGLSQVPPGVFVASKNGAVDAARSEIMLVMSPHGPYILSIFTKNNKDESWETTNEAWVLTRKVSAIVWKYFER